MTPAPHEPAAPVDSVYSLLKATIVGFVLFIGKTAKSLVQSAVPMGKKVYFAGKTAVATDPETSDTFQSVPWMWGGGGGGGWLFACLARAPSFPTIAIL